MAVDGRGVFGGEKSPELDVIGDWSSGVAGGWCCGHVPSLGGWRWGVNLWITRLGVSGCERGDFGAVGRKVVKSWGRSITCLPRCLRSNKAPRDFFLGLWITRCFRGSRLRVI